MISIKNLFDNLDKTLINKISSISKLINDSDIDLAQIVYWPVGSFQDLHHDIALKNTTLSSVCYLNDDYEDSKAKSDYLDYDGIFNYLGNI